MTLDEWLAYISAQHPAGIAMGLDRVRAVYERMGSPRAPVTITVGGTNGKGSTCSMLERILVEAGYKVGLYIKPHLLKYNERVRLNGADASDDVVVASFVAVEAARGDTPLTYFEMGTLGAVAAFAQAKVDVQILEVGLGGRLDAVNVVDADCTVVTSIDLDHQEYLGNDRESIGFEKAGIFRAGKPAIFGDEDPPTRLVEHARALGAPLQVYGRDFKAERHAQQWDYVSLRSAKRAMPMPALRGRWQLKNAASAIAALDAVADRLPVSLGEIKRGLATVTLAGRLQVIPGRPSVVLDVAHNPHAARALADGLADMPYAATTRAVLAMLGDKDIAGVIDAMRHRVDQWYVSAAAADRAAPASKLVGLLSARGLASVTRTFDTIAAALDAARRDAGPDDRIVAFGSFYTVAEALQALR